MHNLFDYILMLNFNFYLLCYLYDWCIHWFISHKLHLLLILHVCRFWYILVCAPWPKATVKSPPGACIFTLYFLLPCPAPTLPLPLPLPCPALFQIYLLLSGIGGGSYIGNFFSFCCHGQEEEVTQGTLLLLLPPWEVLRLWIPRQLEVESCSTVRLWPRWMKRPSGWMDDGLGGRSQGLLHLHPQKYIGA